VYHGDSLLGEYSAPADIFEETKERVNIYVDPLDLNNNSSLKWEKEFLTMQWDEMPYELKWEIVKAQSRCLKFDSALSNPPFGASNKYTMEKIKAYNESNKLFLAKREVWLKEINKKPLPRCEEIIEEVTFSINQKTGQMQFTF
jgi:hypothetical protein